MASKFVKSPSSPKSTQTLNKDGDDFTSVSKVPGYDKGNGTPGWVKSAAKHAAKKAH
jgi:hypothetical protein